VTVWENAGMTESYRLMIDYEYQGKKEEIHKLKYIVLEIYILSIRFHKIFCLLIPTLQSYPIGHLIVLKGA
jgi:hypothetical protein